MGYRIGLISIAVICILLAVVAIPASIAIADEDDVLTVSEQPGVASDYNSLQEAVENAEDGDTIEIIERQGSQPIPVEPVEGAVIGTRASDGGTLDDGKSLTIRGDGIVAIEPRDGETAPIKVVDNENRQIQLENVILAGDSAEYAVDARSNSNIHLDNVAIDQSISNPFNLADDIGGDDNTGGVIRDDGVYYHSDISSQIESVVDVSGGELELEPPNIQSPELLYFERTSEPLDNNPVLSGNADGIIEVRGGEDYHDDSILNPFDTIEAAAIASSSSSEGGTIINVYPHAQGETYGTGGEDIEFNGQGVSGRHEVTIQGQSLGFDVPEVGGIDFNYQGNYNLRDLTITGDLEADGTNVNVDASNNYWNGPPQDSQTDATSLSSIVTNPYCSGEECDDIVYQDIPYCVQVSTSTGQHSVNCEGGASDIDIDIGGYDTSSVLINQDLREMDVEVDSNVASNLDVEFNVIQSDIDPDSTVTVDASDSVSQEKVQAQFGRTINDLQETTTSTRPFTHMEIQINDLSSFVIPLGQIPENEALVANEDDIIPLPPNTDITDGQIIDSEFTGLTPEQETYVSRFNAGHSEDAFQDNNIPPLTINNGVQESTAVGELKFFDNMRQDNGRATLIRPNSPVRVGFNVRNIPEAQQHFLNVTYSLQAEDTFENEVDVSIVDESGDQMFRSRPPEVSTMEITTEGISDFETRGDTEGLTTEELQIPLSNQEVEYVNDRGELYFIVENEEFVSEANILIYEAKVETTDEFTLDDEEIIDGEFTRSDPEVFPGDLTVQFDVDGTLNPEYDTYDVEPGEELEAEVIMENTGDSIIEGQFLIEDEYEQPDIRYPGPEDGQIDTSTTPVTNEIERVEERLQPGDREIIPVTMSWEEAQFGEHNIRFVELDEDGDRRELGEDGTPNFNAYVLQDTTVNIVDIDVPEEHVVYDNFNSEIVVQNIGDLPGNQTIQAEFGQWSAEETIEFGPGNARGLSDSENTTMEFRRDTHPDAVNTDLHFTRREYTTGSNVFDDPHTMSGPFELGEIEYSDDTHSHYRPNAPFHTEEGEFEYVVTAVSEFDGDSPFVISDNMVDTRSSDVELYNLEINDLNVNTHPDEGGELSQRPTEEEATVYASAWPYVYPSYSAERGLQQYYNGPPTVEGQRTMFSADGTDDTPYNRGAFPINAPNTDVMTQPDNRYFSSIYGHYVRACNPNLHGGQDAVHVPETFGEEEDVNNAFLPFSAQECDDATRQPAAQGMRFVDTTDEDNDIFIDSDTSEISDSVSVSHPSQEMEISGVNPDGFEQLEEDGDVMFASVRISNTGTAQPVTARFEIVSDREITGQVIGLSQPAGTHEDTWGSTNFDDNVVGAGAVELRPEETQEVDVPIIIRNIEDNDGIHELSVRPRAAGDIGQDYLEFTDSAQSPLDMPESPLTGETHDQFTVPINVETYGDVVLEELEPVMDGGQTDIASLDDPDQADEADVLVDSVCRESGSPYADNRDNTDNVGGLSNTAQNYYGMHGTLTPDPVEGLNPRSGHQSSQWGVERSTGDCSPEVGEERAVFEAEFTNYGGDEMEIRPELLAEFEDRENRYTRSHAQNAHLSGDRLFAPYSDEETQQFQAETWSEVRFDGQEIEAGDTVSLEPGQTSTVQFERRFQEPGLYHIRVAPCRAISEDGPQHYNLEGFTGVPDTIDSPTTEDNIAQGTHPTVVNPDGRAILDESIENGAEPTQEYDEAIFHGARGCSEEVSSVFVYDSTEPVADFRIGHSDSTVKQTFDLFTRVDTVDQTPDDGIEAGDTHTTGDPEFKVYEGGLLFFDGSTYDCPNCYDRPHFSPLNLETPDDDFFHSQFRNEVQRDADMFSHRMSTSNTRIAGGGMAGEYFIGSGTDVLVQERGMEWRLEGDRIQGDSPNYGQDGYCEAVENDAVDEHCYMEQFAGPGSSTPNYYQVVPHRFTQTGSQTVELQVWDDPQLTRGEAHTNVTDATVEVVEDNDDPDVDTDHTLHNDFDYDAETSAVSGDTLWHRMEDIYSEVDYRDTPDNFGSDYNDVYEGTRMCMTVEESSDDQIGISQDAWWQVVDGSQEHIDNGIMVTDSGEYLERTGDTSTSTINTWHLQAVKTETRDGDRRCWVFDEENDSGDRDREHTFEYQAWDYAENDETSQETVDVVTDTEAPEFDFLNVQYDSSTGDGDSASDFVWAYNPSTSSSNGNQGYYRGGDVAFDATATDDGIGTACVDLRLQRGTGLTQNGEDIHSSCAIMGDESGSSPEYEGIYGNSAFLGASASQMGTNSNENGYHNSQGWFTANELSVGSYQYQGNTNSGGHTSTTEEEDIFAIDWHGNQVEDTYIVDIIHDETSPDIQTSSQSCGSSSCSDHSISVQSDGYSGNGGGPGGTPIVDAEVIDSSWSEQEDTTSGSVCDPSTSETSPNFEVTSLPEGEHSGTVNVNNDASVSADAGTCSASCTSPSGGEDCVGGSSADIEYDWSFTLEITDAHGNTDTQTYSGTISDDDTESEDCDSCPDNPEDDDEE